MNSDYAIDEFRRRISPDIDGAADTFLEDILSS